MLPVGIYGLGLSDLVRPFPFRPGPMIWINGLMIDMKIRLILQSSIVGLTSKPEQSTQISDITCPFELSEQSV